jgi:hypothetical protein
MTQHTEQNTQAGAVPARIQLDDFIEAVTAGVARAMAAQEEVSGYVLREVRELAPVRPFPGGVTIGLIFPYPNPYPDYGMTGEVSSVRE